MENYTDPTEDEEENPETDLAACGIKPVTAGSSRPGKWKCIGADWKWIEDIGG